MEARESHTAYLYLLVRFLCLDRAPPRASTSVGGRPRVAGEGSARGGKAVRTAVPPAKIDECFTARCGEVPLVLVFVEEELG